MVLAAEESNAALSFRNLARVAVLTHESVGVADLLGAATLVISQPALDALTARAGGSATATAEEPQAKKSKAKESEAAQTAKTAEPATAKESQAKKIEGRADRQDRGAGNRRGGEGLMEHSQVILRPVVSEKSYVLSAAEQVHLQGPSRRAQDTDPPDPVEALFDVHVVEVRTLSVKSKPKRRAGISGRTRTWKKAIVQVRAGESIPIFPGLADPRRS